MAQTCRRDRVAMVVDPWDLPFNGTVVSTRRFVTALAARGQPVRLLTLASREPEAVALPVGIDRVDFPRLSVPGFNRVIDGMRSPLARPVRSRLRAALADCGLVHVQYPFLLGHAAIGEARRMGIPVVCSFHVQPENILLNVGLDSRVLARWLYSLFLWRIHDRADRIVAPSAFAARLLHEHGARVPVTVISNGVPQRFLDAGRARKVACGPPWRIVSVGRLAAEKRQDTLLRAVAQSRHAPAIELAIIGAGPRESALRVLAEALELNVTIGPVPDAQLVSQLAEAHLFVHCGAIELEGMSVLEAMATGNAVIVADSPDSACSMLDLGPHSRFRPGDVDSLTACIDAWIEHAPRRLAAGRDNHVAASRLAHDRMVDALQALYAELIEPACRM